MSAKQAAIVWAVSELAIFIQRLPICTALLKLCCDVIVKPELNLGTASDNVRAVPVTNRSAGVVIGCKHIVVGTRPVRWVTGIVVACVVEYLHLIAGMLHVAAGFVAANKDSAVAGVADAPFYFQFKITKLLARDNVATKAEASQATVLNAPAVVDLFLLVRAPLADNLPGIDGFEFLAKIRLQTQAPVVIVSARESDGEIINGLELGADEYVTKPFAPKVLIARMSALLRRQESRVPNKEQFNFGTLVLEPDAFAVKNGAERINLSTREFDILLALVQANGTPVIPMSCWKRFGVLKPPKPPRLASISNACGKNSNRYRATRG